MHQYGKLILILTMLMCKWSDEHMIIKNWQKSRDREVTLYYLFICSSDHLIIRTSALSESESISHIGAHWKYFKNLVQLILRNSKCWHDFKGIWGINSSTTAWKWKWKCLRGVLCPLSTCKPLWRKRQFCKFFRTDFDSAWIFYLKNIARSCRQGRWADEQFF